MSAEPVDGGGASAPACGGPAAFASRPAPKVMRDISVLSAAGIRGFTGANASVWPTGEMVLVLRGGDTRLNDWPGVILMGAVETGLNGRVDIAHVDASRPLASRLASWAASFFLRTDSANNAAALCATVTV